MTGKKRVSVMAMSPGRTRIMVSKRRFGRWDIPDTTLHWPGGKRLRQPKVTAAHLVTMFTHGVVDPKNLQTWIKNSDRICLPTGGFAYCFSEDLDSIVESANRVNKHLKLDLPTVEMRSIEEVCSSFSKYGGGTIEAVRSMFTRV